MQWVNRAIWLVLLGALVSAWVSWRVAKETTRVENLRWKKMIKEYAEGVGRAAYASEISRDIRT